jgi:hypothetical protein
MDNFPDHLSPAFEGAEVDEPFEQWWPRVRHAYPRVPEEVAREWLHRHWGQSPFSFLQSAAYEFQLVSWASTSLRDIRWNFDNFGPNHANAIEHGRFQVEENAVWIEWLREFMLTTGRFPSPPIIVDNRDGHIGDGYGSEYPNAYILVEGHRRFAIGSYLASQGRMDEMLPFWLMRKR